jgi:hypothetical protein
MRMRMNLSDKGQGFARIETFLRFSTSLIE